MILALIPIFISICITFLMYCIIVGGNISKSKEEREMEDKEQIKFINENNKLGGIFNGRKIIKNI